MFTINAIQYPVILPFLHAIHIAPSARCLQNDLTVSIWSNPSFSTISFQYFFVTKDFINFRASALGGDIPDNTLNSVSMIILMLLSFSCEIL